MDGWLVFIFKRKDYFMFWSSQNSVKSVFLAIKDVWNNALACSLLRSSYPLNDKLFLRLLGCAIWKRTDLEAVCHGTWTSAGMIFLFNRSTVSIYFDDNFSRITCSIFIFQEIFVLSFLRTHTWKSCALDETERENWKWNWNW